MGPARRSWASRASRDVVARPTRPSPPQCKLAARGASWQRQEVGGQVARCEPSQTLSRRLQTSEPHCREQRMIARISRYTQRSRQDYVAARLFSHSQRFFDVMECDSPLPDMCRPFLARVVQQKLFTSRPGGWKVETGGSSNPAASFPQPPPARMSRSSVDPERIVKKLAQDDVFLKTGKLQQIEQCVSDYKAGSTDKKKLLQNFKALVRVAKMKQVIKSTSIFDENVAAPLPAPPAAAMNPAGGGAWLAQLQPAPAAGTLGVVPDVLAELRQSLGSFVTTALLQAGGGVGASPQVVGNDHSLPGTPLYERFIEARATLPIGDTTMRLAFHGTFDRNIESICRESLDPARRGTGTGQKLGEGEYCAARLGPALNYARGGSRCSPCWREGPRLSRAWSRGA